MKISAKKRKGTKAPYTKYKKTPYRYSAELNRLVHALQTGIGINDARVAWEAKHGIYNTSPHT